MSKRWVVRKSDADQARALSTAARIPSLLAALLVSRGITTTEAAQAFLGANLKDHLRDPFLLPGCQDVASRLLSAVKEKKKIVVYGDYDVDGITGTAILYQTLKDHGAEVDYYIPSRFDEGYGLNTEAIVKFAKEDGVQVVVTVDCGVSSIEEAQVANELGLELLITDHHNPSAELPAATAIAHPQLVLLDGKVVSAQSLDENDRKRAQAYPFPSLCGAAVALKVAWGFGQLAHEGPGKPVAPKFRERLKEMLGLAAMGTVADFVPLLDENRALVRSGVQFLHPSIASKGLSELLKVAKYVEGRTKIDSDYIAFQLAPRLNAAGRLCQGRLAVELLISEDQSRTAELADYINNLNESRKTLEKRIQKEAIRQIEEEFDIENDPAFVLAGDWHKGVIGIVAGRLVERFHRPVVLLGTDKTGKTEAVGSARSIPGFNLYAALESCQDLLVRFGGHDAAAGVTIQPENIGAFREAFCDYASRKISEEQRVAELFIDGVFPLGSFTGEAVRQISSLAPFGSANQRPAFAAEKVTVVNPKPMGKDESHFAADFRQNGVSIRGIAFSKKDWIQAMQPYDEPLDIAFKVRISDYNGNVELDILDWCRSK